MASLIKELKEEHARLLEVLKELKGLDVRSKRMEEGLAEVKEVLLAHLRKEDNRLYPLLNRAAEEDKELRETLQIFARDMEGISRFVSSFFKKYANKAHGIDFAVDLGRLFTLLEGRIRKEETILFPAYERLEDS